MTPDEEIYPALPRSVLRTIRCVNIFYTQGENFFEGVFGGATRY